MIMNKSVTYYVQVSHVFTPIFQANARLQYCSIFPADNPHNFPRILHGDNRKINKMNGLTWSKPMALPVQDESSCCTSRRQSQSSANWEIRVATQLQRREVARRPLVVGTVNCFLSNGN